jgi:hypothetical protein
MRRTRGHLTTETVGRYEMGPSTPLHSGLVEEGSLFVLAVVTVAAVGAACLLGLAVAAFVRRQSRPYLLIVAAVAALLARSLVAGVAMVGVLSDVEHHVLEHGLDVVLVGLVVAAVYYARTAVPATDTS